MITQPDLSPYQWFKSDDSWRNRPSSFCFQSEIFEVRKLLGSGGQGESILVEGRLGPNSIIEQYVFKFLNDEWVERAYLEATRFKKIEKLSKHLLRVGRLRSTIIENQNVVGLVYEYVSGDTLDKYRRELSESGSQLSGLEIRGMCLDLLMTVGNLHSVRIVHRDIKPLNIIVDKFKNKTQLTLIDFGLIADISKVRSKGPGTIRAGSPGFAAPEVWTGASPNHKQDVWGFAATMIDFMVGPLDDLLVPKDDHINFRIQKPPADKLSLLDPLANSILNILYRGVEKSADDRPTIEEFIDLLIAADGFGVTSRKNLTNSFVTGLLTARIGSTGVLAPVDDTKEILDSFNWKTHVDSLLDTNLLKDLLAMNLKSVFLTGNPGDGKTTFITHFRDELIRAGGHFETNERLTGWQIKFKDHTFVALYDASESVEGVSSNNRLRNILKLSSQSNCTAIVAANDGRLDAFFLEFADEFNFADDVRNQLRGKPPEDLTVRVVDLKRRALVSLSGAGSLAMKNLKRFVSVDSDWEICEECASRSVCPILRNRSFLNNQDVMDAVEDLLTVSHLQREQRATFRNIRSVFAYLITGDNSCAEVHEKKKENINLAKFRGLSVYELAFNPEAKDALIRDWSKFDPANLPLPGVRRAAVRTNSLIDDETGLSNLPNLSRKIFFKQIPAGFDSSEIKDVYFYLYLDLYRMLLNGNHAAIKQDLLSGISGMSGFISAQNRGLLIGEINTSSEWSVIKILPDSEFEIIKDHRTGSPYLEEIVDGVTLRHNSGVSLPLSLDSFELIMRVANGSVINDRFSDSVFQEVRSFTTQLRKEQVSSAFVVDSSGRMVEAVNLNGVVQLAVV